MYCKEYPVTITTNGTGDGTGYTRSVTGKILQIRYVKNDYANGVDVVTTLETSGTAIWSKNSVDASEIVLPRQGVHDVAGVAATLDGTRLMREPIYVAGERVKIVVAQGGDTKSGTFYVMVG